MPVIIIIIVIDIVNTLNHHGQSGYFTNTNTGGAVPNRLLPFVMHAYLVILSFLRLFHFTNLMNVIPKIIFNQKIEIL